MIGLALTGPAAEETQMSPGIKTQPEPVSRPLSRDAKAGDVKRSPLTCALMTGLLSLVFWMGIIWVARRFLGR